MISIRRRCVVAGLLPALAACSPLSLVDALVPKDPDVLVLASDVPYAEGERRRLDVYAPQRSGAQPLPVVVFTHGGSWSTGDKDEYEFVGRAFAARGYVTVLYNYRLVPEVVFPAFVEDGAAAVRWVRDNIAALGGDPDRILLAGHSAGAYTTAMLALDRRFLKAAGVPASAVKGVAGIAGPYDFLPLDVDATRRAFGAVENLSATQPVNLVRPGAPPFLLVAGADDDVVLPKNTRALADALKAVGVPVGTEVYPDVGHASILLALAVGFRHKAPVLDDVASFFRDRIS